MKEKNDFGVKKVEIFLPTKTLSSENQIKNLTLIFLIILVFETNICR